MALVTVVCSLNQCFKFWDVVWVCKVNDVNIDIVSLESLSKILARSLVLLNWVSNKNDDSLSLIFVHAMFQ